MRKVEKDCKNVPGAPITVGNDATASESHVCPRRGNLHAFACPADLGADHLDVLTGWAAADLKCPKRSLNPAVGDQQAVLAYRAQRLVPGIDGALGCHHAAKNLVVVAHLHPGAFLRLHVAVEDADRIGRSPLDALHVAAVRFDRHAFDGDVLGRLVLLARPFDDLDPVSVRGVDRQVADAVVPRRLGAAGDLDPGPRVLRVADGHVDDDCLTVDPHQVNVLLGATQFDQLVHAVDRVLAAVDQDRVALRRRRVVADLVVINRSLDRLMIRGALLRIDCDGPLPVVLAGCQVSAADHNPYDADPFEPVRA